MYMYTSFLSLLLCSYRWERGSVPLIPNKFSAPPPPPPTHTQTMHPSPPPSLFSYMYNVPQRAVACIPNIHIVHVSYPLRTSISFPHPCPVAIERLSPCRQLQALILHNNSIDAIRNIECCRQLWHIDLTGNKVSTHVSAKMANLHVHVHVHV